MQKNETAIVTIEDIGVNGEGIGRVDGYTLFVRVKPYLPLWSFSLIRKTELWEINKPPAVQVS